MSAGQLLITVLRNLGAFTWGNALMVLVGAGLVWLAISRRLHPWLVLPLGIGSILANLGTGLQSPGLSVLFSLGLQSGILPVIAVFLFGLVLDLECLLANPRLMLFSLAPCAGVFGAFLLSSALNLAPADAAAAGALGALNLPAVLFAGGLLSPRLVGLLAVYAIAQLSVLPLLLAVLTKNRWIAPEVAQPAGEDPEAQPALLKRVGVIFSVVAVVIVGLVARGSALLLGSFLLGPLLRSLRSGGVVDRLARVAAPAWRALLVLTGLTAGSALQAAYVFTPDTLRLLLVALVALILTGALSLAVGWLLAAPKSGGFPRLGAEALSGLPLGEPGEEEMRPGLDARAAVTALLLGGLVSTGVLVALISLLVFV